MEITYESEKERLNDELMYYMDKDKWPYLKDCFLAYCNLEDADKKRIVKLDKKIQARPHSRLNDKDEVLLCTAYFINNSKEFCDSLSDESLLLYSEYYLYTAIANPKLGKDKKELLDLACDMRDDLKEQMVIVQLGENLLNDKEYNFDSVGEVCDFIKNTSSEEIAKASVYYINKFINSKEVQQIARKVGL